MLLRIQSAEKILYYKNVVKNQSAEKMLEDGYLVLIWQAAEGRN